jgi:hypothetical protein
VAGFQLRQATFRATAKHSASRHATHIPSTLQHVSLLVQKRRLAPGITPTEEWLVQPLIKYAESAGLQASANYLVTLRNELARKLTLASQNLE